MAKFRLDERRVDKLKPRRSAYDVRDRELTGFGVRVLPSAYQAVLHPQPTRRAADVGHRRRSGADQRRRRPRACQSPVGRAPRRK